MPVGHRQPGRRRWPARSPGWCRAAVTVEQPKHLVWPARDRHRAKGLIIQRRGVGENVGHQPRVSDENEPRVTSRYRLDERLRPVGQTQPVVGTDEPSPFSIAGAQIAASSSTVDVKPVRQAVIEVLADQGHVRLRSRFHRPSRAAALLTRRWLLLRVSEACAVPGPSLSATSGFQVRELLTGRGGIGLGLGLLVTVAAPAQR